MISHALCESTIFYGDTLNVTIQLGTMDTDYTLVSVRLGTMDTDYTLVSVRLDNGYRLYIGFSKIRQWIQIIHWFQ